MRILIWGVSNTFGGVESFICNSIISIKNANPDIDIDCIGFSQPQVKKVVADYSGTFFEIDQLNDSQINSFFYKNAHIYDVLWYNCVDLSHIEILRMAKKNGIKRVVIHSHSSSMIVSGKIKKIYHLGRHYLHRVIVKKYATDYWACSDVAAKWLFPKGVLYNVKYIPNAIDSGIFRYNRNTRETIRNAMKWNKSFVIAQIGRISEEKDPLYAVSIYQEIAKRDKTTKLVFIGDGPLKTELEKYVQRYEINSSVQFLGKRKDVYKLLQGIDAVLLTSNFEGFPMVSVEAQASGTPLYVSEEAVTKQIKIVDNCYFVKKSDGPEKWAEMVIKTRKEKVDNYYIMCEKGFDVTTAGYRLLDLLSN